MIPADQTNLSNVTSTVASAGTCRDCSWDTATTNSRSPVGARIASSPPETTFPGAIASPSDTCTGSFENATSSPRATVPVSARPSAFCQRFTAASVPAPNLPEGSPS